jgi:F-type H+-transporting ATPase subunit alpha
MRLSYLDYKEKIGEIGIVTQSIYPLVFAHGIPRARVGEEIFFATGQKGEVLQLERDTAVILNLDPLAVRNGTELVRTGDFMSVPVGKELLGMHLDALGNGKGVTLPLNLKRQVIFDETITPLTARTEVKRQMITGMTLADILIPIGKGQRELIVGDRKTGKTAFALSAILQQAKEGGKVIYVGIGKTQTEIERLWELFQADELKEHVVMISTSSMDNPGLIYLAPYTGMSIAEHFVKEGEDVMVVLDDLSTHAKYYREMSLIARKFPGRESYPGDIFYIHSRLLERAGAFQYGDKEIAITCLPIAQTVEGDLSGFISTNLMGMTDGHIFFDMNVFKEGRRPSININLSVTRVGKQTQFGLLQDVNRKLMAFIVEYQETATLSHFGAELSQEVRTKLDKGNMLMKLFDQNYRLQLQLPVQLMLVGLIWNGDVLDMEVLKFYDLREALIKAYETDAELQKVGEEIIAAKKFDEFLTIVSNAKGTILALCQKEETSKES